ncbi:MAG: EF-hand domain protein, partial [Caulobacter sp.]|nr:EF-hand domain protein [Caulobacter sp.]
MKRWFGAGFVLVALAGCASPGGERPEHHGMRGGRHGGPPGAFGPGGPRPAALFISPCGRPYRSAAGEAYPVGLWFATADTNHDGKLDRAEFRADADLFFQVLDRDHDGVVAGEEITFYEQRIVPEILAGPGAQADAGSAAPDLLIRVQMQGGGGGMPGGGGGGGGGGGRRGGS